MKRQTLSTVPCDLYAILLVVYGQWIWKPKHPNRSNDELSYSGPNNTQTHRKPISNNSNLDFRLIQLVICLTMSTNCMIAPYSLRMCAKLAETSMRSVAVFNDMANNGQSHWKNLSNKCLRLSLKFICKTWFWLRQFWGLYFSWLETDVSERLVFHLAIDRTTIIIKLMHVLHTHSLIRQLLTTKT